MSKVEKVICIVLVLATLFMLFVMLPKTLHESAEEQRFCVEAGGVVIEVYRRDPLCMNREAYENLYIDTSGGSHE